MSQVKVGVILTYVKRIANILVGLFYVPMILSFLTVEQYGLFQMVASLVAYLAILDLGLSGTIVRYYTQKLAAQDREGMENVVAISLLIYTGIGILILLGGIVLYNLIGSLYSARLSSAEIATAKSMMILLIIDVALMIPSRVFSSIITSHEKFIFLRTISILQTLLQPFVAYFILRVHPAAMSLVIVQVSLDLVSILVLVLYAFTAIKVRIRLHSFDSPLVKSMITFSLFIFLSMTVEQVYLSTGQIILGAMRGPTEVAVYSIAIQFNTYLRLFGTAIVSVMLPSITRITEVSNDMKEINSIFTRVGRIQFFIVALILSGFILFGRQFITLWIGMEFLPAYAMALIVMIPYALDLVTSLGNTILMAKNQHGARALILAGSALISIILQVLLSRRLGGIGTACALGVAFLAGNGIASLVYYQRKGIDLRRLWKDNFPALVGSLFALGIGFLSLRWISVQSWGAVISGIVLYSIAFTGVMWVFGLRSTEKIKVLNIIRTRVKRWSRM